METIFEQCESEVRSYSRMWPTTFRRAHGSWIYDIDENPYLDFFAGAGALNYGHNPPILKERLVEFLRSDGITHGLDMQTEAKGHFLEMFRRLVLEPRGLDHRVQFTGPTGANAVEAALKLARKVTGRSTVVAFTNAFHGMSLGALSITGNATKRRGAGLPLTHTVWLPYDGCLADAADGPSLLDGMLSEPGSGLDTPAAVIVETIQGEGGVNTAATTWLRRLVDVCTRHGILLIVDDIQMGCGRTGRFFSFEEAGLRPDLIVLSKSIGGYGLPLALTLIRPELDVWSPGEHSGTFRGNNPAFVTGAAALEEFWGDDVFAASVRAKGATLTARLDEIARRCPEAEVRGRGLAGGLRLARPGAGDAVVTESFRRGLVVETAGPRDDVVKVMPPLTVTEDELATGCDVLADAVAAVHDEPTTGRPAGSWTMHTPATVAS